MIEKNRHETTADSSSKTSPRRDRIFRIAIPFLILVVGIAIAAYVRTSAPRTAKRKPPPLTPLVRVKAVQPSDHRVILNAIGTVIPARELELKSPLSGEIVSIHPEFTEGGILRKGARILQIDPRDYELVVIQQESAVAQAEYALKLEKGYQEVARQEWDLINKGEPAADMELELALRKPHLDKVRADLKAARATLEKAQLDLKRTAIHAPFDAVVQSKSVDLGSQVTPQMPLARLIATASYWVQASVSVDRLDWIQVPRTNGEKGSMVTIEYAGGHPITGRVTRLLSDLATEGLMARILIEVKDPLGLSRAEPPRLPLLINEVVRVEIKGRLLKNIFRLPQTAMRDNSSLWIVREDGGLEIRQVAPVWMDADSVLIDTGLAPGDRIVISELAGAVGGMPVRVAGRPGSNKEPLQPSKQSSKGGNG